MNNTNTLARLQDWYLAMTNGDWEHTYGIDIGNIDNPGWTFKVELVDTPLYEVAFEKFVVQREAKDNWLHCEVKDGNFKGAGGPLNLEELMVVFLDWAETHS